MKKYYVYDSVYNTKGELVAGSAVIKAYVKYGGLSGHEVEITTGVFPKIGLKFLPLQDSPEEYKQYANDLKKKHKETNHDQ